MFGRYSLTLIVASVLSIYFLETAAIGLDDRFVCPPNPCEHKKCEPVHCRKGEIERPGYCGCCTFCAAIIRKGQHCFFVEGGGPSLAVCEPGTTCKGDICV